jgi:hypothetical protein
VKNDCLILKNTISVKMAAMTPLSKNDDLGQFFGIFSQKVV